MIIIIIYYYIDSNIKKNLGERNSAEIKIIDKIDKDIDDIKEMNTNNFYININSGNIKFLVKNKEFLDIIKNLRFIKKFDKTRYNNLIILMNKLMKIYIYILADRYDSYVYIPILNDIKNDIFEILYSLVFVVPERFKHIYGFNPTEEIEKSLNDFRIKVANMLIVLDNYGKLGKDKKYLDIHKYSPYEKNKELYLP
ncbi:MAG: hypothetical protein ACOVNU_12625 [Candidatus Kapaibacteriota bacterium]